MKSRGKIDLYIVLGIVFLHTIIIYKLYNNNMILRVNDEMVYFGLAKSLFSGRGLVYHGVNFPLKNLAYVIYLQPFMCIKDVILRMHCIQFFNSFCCSFSILVAWLMAKELQLKGAYLWGFSLLIAIWPDVCIIPGTMMSENLYWVSCVITFYFLIKLLKYRNYIYSIILGVCFYINIFCKEVGICLLLAYVVYELLEIVYKSLYKKINEVRICLKSMIIVLLIFVTIYIVVNIVFFQDFDNAYDNMLTLNYLKSTYSQWYLIYAFIYYVIATVVAFLVLPFIIPIVYFNILTCLERKIFIYSLVALTGTIFTIVFTITVREDIGAVVPRVHLRYYSPLIVLFQLILFSIFNNSLKEALIERRKKILIGCVIIAFLIIGLFKGGGVPGCYNESASLFYIIKLKTLFPILKIGVDDSLNIYTFAVCIAFILIVVTILMILLLKIKKTYTVLLVFIVFSFTCIMNQYSVYYDMNNWYSADLDKIKEVKIINDYINNNDSNANVMLIVDSWNSYNGGIFDTYYDFKNYYQMSYNDLLDLLYKNDDVDIPREQFNEILYRNHSFTLDSIDYFVVADGQDLTFCINGLEKVKMSSVNSTYQLYKNIDNTLIRNRLAHNENLIINFDSKSYNADNYIEYGISYCEGNYSWTDGDVVSVKARVDRDISSVKVSIYFCNVIDSPQEVIIIQDDKTISRQCVNSGEDILSFEMNIAEGDCDFKIYFPDAISPKELGLSEDSRKLSIAISNIEIINDVSD